MTSLGRLWVLHDPNRFQSMVAESRKAEMLPRRATANHTDGGDTDSEMSGRILQGSSALAHGVDVSHFGIVQFGHAVLGASISVAAKFAIGMLVILARRKVFQVFCARVVLVAVFVVDLMALWLRPNECQRHEDVDEYSPRAINAPNADTWVGFWVVRVEVMLQKFVAAFDAAVRANLVAGVVRNESPLVGHGLIVIQDGCA